MIKTFANLAIVAAALVSTAPAVAQSVVVPYGDLNLASAAGAETLEKRLKVAAIRVCGFEQAPGLAETLSVKKCRAGVLDTARPQVSQAIAMRSAGSISVTASR